MLQPETEVRLYNWTVTHEFSEQNTELFYNNPDQPIAESSQDSEKSFTLPIHHTIDRKDLRCYYEKKHEVFVSRASGEIRNSSRELVAKLEGITGTSVKRDSMTQLSREAVRQLTRAQHQSAIFNKDLICRWNPSVEWKRLLARTQPL